MRTGFRYGLSQQATSSQHSSVTDTLNDEGRTMPDLLVGHFDDDPTSPTQSLQPSPVTLTVDQSAVEQRALDLDDHAEPAIDEVDPAYPAVDVTDVDLPFERGLSCPFDDVFEPSLEVAVSRSVARPVERGRVAAARSCPGAPPAAERLPPSSCSWLRWIKRCESIRSQSWLSWSAWIRPARSCSVRRGVVTGMPSRTMMSDSLKRDAAVHPADVASVAMRSAAGQHVDRMQGEPGLSPHGGRRVKGHGAGRVECGRHRSLLGGDGGTSDPQDPRRDALQPA